MFRLSALLLSLLVCFGTVGVVPAGAVPVPDQPPDGYLTVFPSEEENLPEPVDPFKPELSYHSLKLAYELEGRLEGQAQLMVNDGTSLYRIEAKDNAFGLERQVEQVVIRANGRIVNYDVKAGVAHSRPDYRILLSQAWRKLDREQKLVAATNAEKYGLALGKPLRQKKIKKRTVEVFGLPTVEVSFNKRQVWYWADTDIVLKETIKVEGLPWTRTVVDIMTNAAVKPEDLAPPKLESPPELLVPPELIISPPTLTPPPDEPVMIEARHKADWMMALLGRPVVSRAIADKEAQRQAKDFAEYTDRPEEGWDEIELDNEEAFPSGDWEQNVVDKERELLAKRQIPWPAVPPPSFRDEADRYRMSPTWQPYPLPPWTRVFPAAGLEDDVLAFRAGQAAKIIIGPKPKEEPMDSKIQD